MELGVQCQHRLPRSYSALPQLRRFTSRAGPHREAAAPSSPLVELQRNVREVNHMAPHVLSAAVSNAGTSRLRNDALWRAYTQRAVSVGQQFTMRDIRLTLQGYAEVSIRDQALFKKLAQYLQQRASSEITPKSLCSVAVAFAKLQHADEFAYSWIAQQVLQRLDVLDPTELGSLVNAFSRVSCCDAEFFDCIAVSFKMHLKNTPERVSPAAAALILNGFAVCSRSDVELWESMLNTMVSPRISEFSISQVALVMNSIARCASSIPSAASICKQVAQHWSIYGQLERAVKVEDIAYLANAFYQLGEVHHTELNLALASCALRKLSYFTPGQLSMLCNAMAHLPSSGKHAFLAMAAQHATPILLPQFSLSDLALIMGAFVSCRTPLPRNLSDKIYGKVVVEANRAAGSVAKMARGSKKNHSAIISNNKLVSLCKGLVHYAAPSSGISAVQALQPLVATHASSELVGDRGKSGLTIASLIGAQANLRVRDILFSQTVEDCLCRHVESITSMSHLEQVLSSVATLKIHSVKLLTVVDGQLLKLLPDLTYAASIRILMAFSTIGFANFSPRTTDVLLPRVRDLFNGVSSEDGILMDSKAAAQLQIAASAWRLHARSEHANLQADSMLDWTAEATDKVLLPDRMDPLPPLGLLREVHSSLSRLLNVSHDLSHESPSPLGAGKCVGGFYPDLVFQRTSDSIVAIEVDGPQRFYYGTQDRLAVIELKRVVLQQFFDEIICIGSWEWPDDKSDQERFLRERLLLQ